MARRTIYVRDEDESLFDTLAQSGNLSAVIARAVKAEHAAEKPAPGSDLQSLTLFQKEGGRLLSFSVDPPEDAVRPSSVVYLMQVDPLTLEVGKDLLHLFDPQRGAVLLERVTSIRRHIAVECGFVLPGIRFRDNLQLKPNGYRICVREVEVARGEIEVGSLLAVGTAAKSSRLKGMKTVDPTYGMPGLWIRPDQKEDAVEAGLLVFNEESVIATHLTEVVRVHADEILGYEETEALIDQLRKTHARLLAAVIPAYITMEMLWQVLQGLLRERVCIRDLTAILEGMLARGAALRDVNDGIETARLALRRQICREYTNREGEISVLTLDPDFETRLMTESPSVDDVQLVSEEVARLNSPEAIAILLCEPASRPRVRDIIRRSADTAVVLSRAEIIRGTRLKILGTIGAPD